MTDFLNSPIQYLKGVGPKRAELLQKELNISTFHDLINFFPFRYIDRTKFYKINEIREDLPYVQICGKIKSVELINRPQNKRLVAIFYDDTGEMELVWFHGFKWIKDALKPNVFYVVFGKPNYFQNHYSIIHPEIDVVSDDDNKINPSIVPVYNSTEKLKAKGLNSKGISKLLRTLIDKLLDEHIPETLPDEILSTLNLLLRESAFLNIHFPQNIELLQKAQYRLKFEELFFIQLQLLQNKFLREHRQNGHVFATVGEYFNQFYKKNLPFPLTNSQQRVIKEIRKDTKSGRQMNRLLQGDVGSGKTLVALMSMLLALDNGFQACLMAPTEILAQQHYKNISELLQGLEIQVKLLTRSTKRTERKIIHHKLQTGELQILIGTHALIEDVVQFKNLGLVIIDEQHRFGVAQRAKLWEKNIHPPHILVMTATPIPRTLAMTLYGDLDVSVIDELPPGRIPVKTFHRFESSRQQIYEFIKNQIDKGRQVYIVYPLIKESEVMDLKNLEDGFKNIVNVFLPPKYQVGMVHGLMKSDEREREMSCFANKETQILVCTTVIEVGIDIPNANVMIIENAERFGLSQLHQLRGRISRSTTQAYCILMTKERLSEEAKIRIETMLRTTNGFDIAEIDLNIRGPGDIQGTLQSGLIELKIADLAKDGRIVQIARDTARTILEQDPFLKSEKNSILLEQLNLLNKNKKDWSRIS